MSNIILLNDHKYLLPPVPKSQEEVFFVKDKKENQYWRRPNDFPEWFYKFTNDFTVMNSPKTEYNSDGFLISLSESDTKKLVRLREREMQRRWDGIWFMNYGEPTYLTGGHYFDLVWGAMPGYSNPYEQHPFLDDQPSQYGEYKEFYRDTHYMLDLVKKNPNAGGLFIGKGKKTGITNLISKDYVDESTKYIQKRFGMMSKSREDCMRANFAYYEYCFDQLPDVFKPSVANRTTMLIKFGKVAQKRSGSKNAAQKQLEAGQGFDSEIFVAASKADAFDGPVMFRSWSDEFPKYEDPYPEEVFKRSKETVKLGGVISGKYLISSYTPESDGRNFKEAKKVWREAQLDTYNQITQQTANAMLTFFLPSDCTYETNNLKFDRYGKLDRKKALHIITAKREALQGDRNALQAERRQYPLTAEEMWQEGGAGGSTFDNIRLALRLAEIRDYERSGQTLYEEGDLDWKDARMGEVYFKPLSKDDILAGKEGKFRFYRYSKIPSDIFNRAVKANKRDLLGRLQPDPNTLFVAATDPVDYVGKDDVVMGSKNAITGMIFLDTAINTAYNEEVTDRLFADYLSRPDDPDDYYEDLLLFILYTGCFMYAEGNKPWVTKKLKDDKMHNFIIVRTTDKLVVPYDEHNKDHQRLTTTVRNRDLDVIEEICRAVNTYYRKPTKEDPTDRMKQLDSSRAIEQYMSFKPMDTKKTDLAMCAGLNIVAMNGIKAWRIANASRGSNYDRDAMRVIYDRLISGV